MTADAQTPVRERRRTRSGRLQLALNNQLRHVLELYGFDDVVLANEDGLIVSSAGAVSRAATLAAIAPLMADGQDGAAIRRHLPEIGLDRIAVHSLEVDHEPLFLSVTTQSTADTRKAIGRAFEHLESGVRRIFGTLAQPA